MDFPAHVVALGDQYYTSASNAIDKAMTGAREQLLEEHGESVDGIPEGVMYLALLMAMEQTEPSQARAVAAAAMTRLLRPKEDIDLTGFDI